MHRTQSRGCQRTATAVHASIVSLLVDDVRHIAAPSQRQKFERLGCRLFRDKVGGYPVRIKITNPDHSALVGIGSNSGGLESLRILEVISADEVGNLGQAVGVIVVH